MLALIPARVRLQLVVTAAVIGLGAWAYSWVYDKGAAKVQAQWDAETALADELRASDKREQRTFGDRVAGAHVVQLEQIGKQLGVAREKIASLSGRVCLDASTVGVLNGIEGGGEQPGRAATGGAAGAAQAVATDRDVATFIATCRGQYGQVSDQLNKILDIEDRRHPP